MLEESQKKQRINNIKSQQKNQQRMKHRRSIKNKNIVKRSTNPFSTCKYKFVKKCQKQKLNSPSVRFQYIQQSTLPIFFLHAMLLSLN